MKTQNLKIAQIVTIALLLISSISLSAQNTDNNFWTSLIKYDDGSAEDFVVWVAPGGIFAVKFISYNGYPINVLGGEISVGDGTFPGGEDFIGTSFLVCLFDDDGLNGLPGTLLDSAYVEVENYEWIVFDSVFNTTITDGAFYVAMKQLVHSPDCAPVGVDTDLPTSYESYAKQPDGEWTVSPYQDFMIRAYVTNVTGINNIINNENIAVYPNPAIKNIRISSEKKINEIRIIDLQGKEILRVENLDTKKCDIDVSKLKEGTYFVRMMHGNTMVNKKLIITK